MFLHEKHFHSRTADELKVVDVPIMQKCKYAYDQESKSICAGETFGTRDACQGLHVLYKFGIIKYFKSCFCLCLKKEIQAGHSFVRVYQTPLSGIWPEW